MAKSSKLVVLKGGRVLLVRRRCDNRWMFPGGRKRRDETERQCLHREIGEELPGLRINGLKLWMKIRKKNQQSGRRMDDAIFVARKARGELKIGDTQEIDRAEWRLPRGLKMTPTSRYIRNRLFPK